MGALTPYPCLAINYTSFRYTPGGWVGGCVCCTAHAVLQRRYRTMALHASHVTALLGRGCRCMLHLPAVDSLA